MPAASILFVTGKGGSGKTTVACALAAALANAGERVLLVEPYDQHGLEAHFAAAAIAAEPTRVAVNLDAVRLQARPLLEEYFRKLLRLPLLARTLLSSAAFNALTAAAPGVSEFLVLDRLQEWSREPTYDRLVVDGPATGHALQLLRAPFQLASIASSGPLHRPLRRLTETLTRPERVGVAFVSLCEEMSVAESVEARAVADRFGIAIERPILNRCAPRRFTRDDIGAVHAMDPAHPAVAAARLHIAAQQRTTHFAGRLKTVFGRTALGLPDLVTTDAALDVLGRPLLRGMIR